jgi:rhamnose transport system permease protein
MIFRRHLREISVAVTYGLLLLLLAIVNPNFFHHNQFRQVWVSSAPLIVAAVGMTLVILARHIDISIGAQFSICAVTAGLLAKSGWPMPLVAVGTIAAGCVMGSLNGLLVAFLKLPSIVVTLATMEILQDSLRLANQGAAITGLPHNFQWFGWPLITGQWIVLGSALAILLIFAVAMRLLPAGRAIFAVGSDQEAARLAGIRPRRVVFCVFVLMGALTAMAALLQAVRQPRVDPKSGLGLELEVIAAVVVGGTAISGGRGTLIGSLAGVALLTTISPALIFLTREAYWDKAIQGAIILLAVASDSFQFRRRKG